MHKKTGAALLAFVILFPFTGCAVKRDHATYIKDGREYGQTGGLFRGRWWNYYERGLSFSDGGFNDEAVKDLERAIDGRGSDQWRARTYGMHFVNYFPHRELGIVYYRQRKIREAIRELETSLESAESAKAKYFLNKARKLDLEASGKDLMPPSIRLTGSHIDEVTTKSLTVTVAGTASDDSFVSSVNINGSPVHLELSKPEVDFSREIGLKEGINRISITAEDLLGRSARREIKVTADWRGPLISLKAVRPGNGPGGGPGGIPGGIPGNGPGRVKGVVTDKSGIAHLVVNGREISSTPEGEFVFEHDLSNGSLHVKATDTAGNVTVATFPQVKKASLQPRGLKFASAAGMAIPVRYAEADNISGSAWEANESIFPAAASGQGGPPVINIENYAKEMEVFSDSILVEGAVSDDDEIVSLKINGEQLLKMRGTALFFSHLVPLDMGMNIVTVEAVNSQGKSSARSMEITRKVQKVRQIGSRMSIAVLPMEKRGESSAVSEAVYGSLVSALVAQARFNVVERERLDDILREFKLGRSGLADPATISRLGNVVPADSMLAGSITEKKKAIEIIAELIDSETSEVISSRDVFDEDKSLGSVARLLERLAWKFKNDFPLLEGLVIDLEGRRKLLVDMGEETHIRKHCRVILFREGRDGGSPGPSSGGRAETEQLGEARITAVFNAFSRARLMPGAETVNILDHVITK